MPLRPYSNGEFGLPLIALAVIALVLLIATKGLMQPVFDVEMANSLAKSAAKMTPEQLEATRNATASFSGWGTLVGVPIAYLVTPFILGGIAWLVAKVVGVKQTYAVAVMIATFTLSISSVSTVAYRTSLLGKWWNREALRSPTRSARSPMLAPS